MWKRRLNGSKDVGRVKKLRVEQSIHLIPWSINWNSNISINIDFLMLLFHRKEKERIILLCIILPKYIAIILCPITMMKKQLELGKQE